MQDKNVIDRLNNPPQGKESYENFRTQVTDIIKDVLSNYENGNVSSDAFKHQVSNEIFSRFISEIFPPYITGDLETDALLEDEIKQQETNVDTSIRDSLVPDARFSNDPSEYDEYEEE